VARLLIREGADADIDAIARFIANDNLNAGQRFYDAVAHDVLLLAANPFLGAKRHSANPRLKHLRSWPVTGYRNCLLFYLATNAAVDVLRAFTARVTSTDSSKDSCDVQDIL
jgi:plasmid stabilization system protein ParE